MFWVFENFQIQRTELAPRGFWKIFKEPVGFTTELAKN
jgi:hypothetical protein